MSTVNVFLNLGDFIKILCESHIYCFFLRSVGCTVVEMLTGRPPLGHLEPVAAIFEIGSNPTVPTLPEGVSQDAKEFIQATLTP